MQIEKKSQKGIALIYLVLIIIAIVVVGFGGFFAFKHFSNSKSNNETFNNGQVVENKEENKNTDVVETDANGIAYKFSIDSKNKRVYDVTPFNGTDLYKVQLNGVKNTYYVMDTQGNTIFKVLDNVYTTSDYKYIYTYNDTTIKIYNAVTHKEITPDGINNNFSSKKFFIEGDIICTYNASYNLSSAECLWSGDEINISAVVYKANGLMLCMDSNKNYLVYNYLTGKNLCEGLETYKGCQINSAGYFITQVENIAKVYDSDGKYISQFNVPSKHVITKFIMPGKHFCFYEDKNSPYQVTVTDMSGNIVREDVYIRTWSDTFSYHSSKDIIMVHGDLTNRNHDWFSGILDSSMNWIISQSDKLYAQVHWLYGDIYSLRDDDYNYYLYNSTNGSKLDTTGGIYVIKYYTNDNKIIKSSGKMYKADTLELINIEYKEGYEYYQLSKDTFVEYEKYDKQNITVYDVNGNLLKKIDLGEGTKYSDALNDTIITYNDNTGYSLISIKDLLNN